MNIINDHLVTEAEKYLAALMADKLPENIIYHNYRHALLIRKHAETIGRQAGLDGEEMNILRLSALFHDSGYIASYERWNEESVAIAVAFLEEHAADRKTIDRVGEVIASARIPQAPKDRVAEALCDAGLMYITGDGAVEQFDLLYEETALMSSPFEKRSAFEKKWIDFFTQHTFFTEYGRTILQPGKEATLQRLAERIKRRKLLDGKKEQSQKNGFDYSRGVESMFRITARNQINLNSIADNKSNILISVSAIIISIIITMLAGNIGNMAHDIIPILVLLFICLATIVIAILSTRPNIVTTRFTAEDIKNNKVDLIFFGNFIKLSYEEYERALSDLMKEEEHLYSTLIKNQYALGKILSKKFRLVRIAYNVFMIGIIITVIVFVLNYLIY